MIKFNKYDYILISFSVFFILISLYSFISNTKDAIQILLNTSYPGKRSITGGGFDFNYLQLYLSNWMLPYEHWLPPNESSLFSNTCEASTFPNFLPAILFSFFRLSKFFSYKRYLFYTLFIYLLFLMTWLIFSYPEWFAKYTLFSFQNRLYYIVNLIALYLSIWTLSVIIKYNPLKKFEAAVITILTAYIYSHSVTHSVMLHYLGMTKTILSIFFFTALTFFFLTGMKKTFSVLMISYILVSGWYVNPVSRGLDPIYNKTIAEKLLSIEKNNPDKRWVALNTWFYGDYLNCLGIKTINSGHFYPDLSLWNKIDPQSRYDSIYNRSAHVVVQLMMNEETIFMLNSFDTFTVFLNINDLLLYTDVDYILSYGKIEEKFVFFEEIESVEKDNLYIYKLKRDF